MKKSYLISLLLVLAFFIVHCSKDDMTSPQDDLQVDEIVFDQSDNEDYQSSLAKGNMDFANEIRLKYFAEALAKTLSNPGACRLLKQEIGKKFDGDYDVLWETVKDENISDKGKFRKLISDRLGEGRGSFLSIDEIENVPFLQISLPVNFEKWDGEKPILVAYTPLTIDDMEWKEIYAYDADMKEYILDAKTPPDFPVMVVGINERIEYNRMTLDQTKEKIFSKTTTVRQSEEILDSIRISIDGEGWLSGDPEIYIVSAGTKSLYDRKERANLTSVNKINKWYTIDAALFNWETEYWGDHTGYGVLEYDPSGYNYSVSILTENVQVKVKNESNDDFIGNIYSIPYTHTNGAIWLFDDVKMGLSY
ncbi:MAG: DUF3103 domain-containing protein [Candidatus Marinimicrobia bacterium]|nr:DUF3103 domain-containing protein [bacterium]MCG2717010.1 DUF3103 domain-containing protein [Candidatus Neomarinimicrobiota bacterium]